MKLLNLELRNFKGIKNFTLDAQGGNVDIFGENATGKTTLYDAFLWLLFDKDSANKKDFAIKTLGKDGEPIHGLDHSVEGTFLVNGSNLSLTKVYSEQWTKKRGSATKEFTGHTTDYFINSVPVKKTEYAAKVAEIINEDIFRLLTNPLYFNEQLHWEKRRAILLEVCGDLTDAEVIASDKKLAALPGILGDHSLEDYRKIIASRRTKINDELKKIPVRIDEVTQGMPNIEAIDAKGIDAEIDLLNQKISAKREEMAGIENGGEVSKLRNEIREIEGKLLQLKNDHRAKVDAVAEGKREELQKAMKLLQEKQEEYDRLHRLGKNHAMDIADLETKRNNLRLKWVSVNDQQFVFSQDDTCPTCGQSLPADKLTSAREEALATFNAHKARTLEEINSEGKLVKEAIDKLRTEKEKLVNDAATIKVDIEKATSQVTSIKAEVDAIITGAGDGTQEPAYIDLVNEKNSILGFIEGIMLDSKEATQKINEEIASLTSSMRVLESTKAELTEYERCQNRIAELSQQERDLAAEFEKLEGELYLTEEFVKAKVNLLEEKINSKFKLARFKLFETQVNGGISDCCETTFNGVPYSSGLNNAARINVGLDIINTLAEHYNFDAPIFVDNAEAVVELIPTRGQVIRLVVFEGDKTLRVETHGQNKLFKEAM